MSDEQETVAAGRGVSGTSLVVTILLALLGAAILAWILFWRPQPETSESNTIYVIDASARMLLPLGQSDSTRLQAARNLVNELMRGASATSVTGIRLFGSGATDQPCVDTTLLVPPAANNQQEITQKLGRLQTGLGEAALTAAIIAAIGDLRLLNHSGPRLLVLITGGEDTCAGERSQFIAEELARANIDLRTIAIDLGGDQRSARALRVLVADLGGGTYLEVDDEVELSQVTDRLQSYFRDFEDITFAGLGEPVAAASPAIEATAATRTATLTPSATASATRRPSATPTLANSRPTLQPTATSSTTLPTLTPTVVGAVTTTATATRTPSPTITGTPSPTATSTPLPTATHTPSPTVTSTPTLVTPTVTSSPTSSPTFTPPPPPPDTPTPTPTSPPPDTPTPTATPTTLIVDGNCADDDNDGRCDVGTAFKTIQAGINAAAGGDTIQVTTTGAHTEGGIVVNKALTIAGQGAGSTVVQAATTQGGASTHVFQIGVGSTVTLQAMAIQHGLPGIINDGALTLGGTAVRDNGSLNAGGGILNNGVLAINNSTIAGNNGTSGGGLFNAGGTVTINRSTISGNSASPGDGGGIFTSGGQVTINSSTISGNTAAATGGGVTGSQLTINNSTIVNNNASSGGGIGPGAVTIQNSIVADNPGGNCSVAITSADYNLSSDATCAFTAPNDQQNTAPELTPLQNNGGPTQTHEPLTSPVISPAIDAGNDAACPATDQRGQPRPRDGDNDGAATCDIGSVEFQPPIPNRQSPMEHRTITNPQPLISN